MTTDIFLFAKQIQTSQTGGQQYSDTSPFSIPWSYHPKAKSCQFHDYIAPNYAGKYFTV